MTALCRRPAVALVGLILASIGARVSAEVTACVAADEPCKKKVGCCDGSLVCAKAPGASSKTCIPPCVGAGELCNKKVGCCDENLVCVKAPGASSKTCVPPCADAGEPCSKKVDCCHEDAVCAKAPGDSSKTCICPDTPEPAIDLCEGVLCNALYCEGPCNIATGKCEPLEDGVPCGSGSETGKCISGGCGIDIITPLGPGVLVCDTVTCDECSVCNPDDGECIPALDDDGLLCGSGSDLGTCEAGTCACRCQNGGTCEEDRLGNGDVNVICKCLEGWSGDLCDLELDFQVDEGGDSPGVLVCDTVTCDECNVCNPDTGACEPAPEDDGLPCGSGDDLGTCEAGTCACRCQNGGTCATEQLGNGDVGVICNCIGEWAGPLCDIIFLVDAGK